MFDNNFNPIHFSYRDEFIMNDLGFNEIGKVKEPFTYRDFPTVTVRFDELVSYLKMKGQ